MASRVSALGSLRLSRNIREDSPASFAKAVFIIGIRATGFGENSTKVRKPAWNWAAVAASNHTG